MAKDIKRTELLLHMYQELSTRILRVEKDLEELINSKNDDPLKSEISKSIPVVERSSSKNDVLNDSSQSNKLSEILNETSKAKPLPPIDSRIKEYASFDDIPADEIVMYRGHRVEIPRVKFSDPEKQNRFDKARATVFELLNEGSGSPIYDIARPTVKDNGAAVEPSKELCKDPTIRTSAKDVQTACARFYNVLWSAYAGGLIKNWNSAFYKDNCQDLALLAHKICDLI